MVASKSPQTALIHPDYKAPEGFAAFPGAIHHASTVLFKNVAAMRSGDWKDKNAYTYGLHGTPTTFTLEARLAEIEGGQHCLLAPSGLAAIAMVDFALLRSGDDVLLPDNVYNPNRELGRWLSADFGVTARYYDPMTGDGIAALKDALKSDDVEGIKEKTNTLAQASMKLGEAMYKAQQAGEAATDAAADGAKPADDNVVDADFEEVDDSKK